jgi:hypothetical protein
VVNTLDCGSSADKACGFESRPSPQVKTGDSVGRLGGAQSSVGSSPTLLTNLQRRKI